jgi:hypothetical protein
MNTTGCVTSAIQPYQSIEHILSPINHSKGYKKGDLNIKNKLKG